MGAYEPVVTHWILAAGLHASDRKWRAFRTSRVGLRVAGPTPAPLMISFLVSDSLVDLEVCAQAEPEGTAFWFDLVLSAEFSAECAADVFTLSYAEVVELVQKGGMEIHGSRDMAINYFNLVSS